MPDRDLIEAMGKVRNASVQAMGKVEIGGDLYRALDKLIMRSTTCASPQGGRASISGPRQTPDCPFGAKHDLPDLPLQRPARLYPLPGLRRHDASWPWLSAPPPEARLTGLMLRRPLTQG